MEATPANPYSTPAANLYGSTTGGSADAVSPTTIAMLAGTKPWVRFFSVLMWISVGLMLLAAAVMIVLSTIGAAKSLSSGPFGGKQLIVFAVVYGILAYVYIGKFAGVMTIILISMYLVAIIGFVAFGATAAMKAGAFPH